MAQLISGAVNAVGGVNARKEPAITGEVLQLLDEGASVTVVRQEGEWLQIILPDGVTVAWAAADFITQVAQPITLAELAAIYTQAGLPAPVAAALPPSEAITDTAAITSLLATATQAATTALTDTVAPTDTASLTDTAALTGAGPTLLVTSGVVPDAPFTNTLPLVGPALTVTDTTGVNARSAPSTEGAIIVAVPNGAVLPVTGRNTAGDWLQVRLPDGATGWMFADAVVASADAAAAPVAEEASGTQTTTAPAATTPISGAPAGATATVINELGANLRPAPSRDLDGVFFAEANQSFTVVGRSGDGEWVQVVLPDGSLAWALLTTVNLSVGADSLPVTQP
jgi:N-acetylmuramoyl-L-alanine amidase